MDFASARLEFRKKNSVTCKVIQAWIFLSHLNAAGYVFKNSCGLLLFLSYLITTLGLHLFLSYPSFHILSSLRSDCMSQPNAFLLLSTSSPALTNYSSFFISSLVPTLLNMLMTSLFQAPINTCATSVNPSRLCSTTHISTFQNSSSLFHLSL